MIAASPENESDRLANLKGYHILDTEPEPAFNDLVSMAGTVAETPICLISLIDANRQWFKAKIGINLVSTPRDIAFCSHAILSVQPTIVSDATTDCRFSDHPFVTQGQNFRFYAGFPLISKEGFVLGTLCVIDHVPRRLSVKRTQLLKILAQQVVSLMELHRAEKLIEQQKNLMQNSAKLVALGQMTAEIVHEINNPLAVISARASMLVVAGKQQTLTPEMTQDNAEQMLETSRRINKVIQGLSGFIRNSDQEISESVVIEELIDETLSFCIERCRSEKIELRVQKISPKIRMVCRPIQVSQVLLNLLNNAVDAVSVLDVKWVSIALNVTEHFFEIVIGDSGPGIEPELHLKIFEPFFTTKQKGRGIGLGLSISKGIIKAHRGSVRYDGSSGHTQFVMCVPKLPHNANSVETLS